jgi:predicted RecB family nuclease
MLSPTLPSGFTFSQSSLQDYSDCPRRFQLRYIDQLQWPAVEVEPVLENELHQLEGQLFHKMVQQHLIGIPVGKLTRFANTPDLSRWWEHYLNTKFEFTGCILQPELILTTPVGMYHLIAKFDLVAFKPGERAVIYDWKTTRKRPKDEWMAARMQTRVYRAMLIQAGATLNGGAPLQPAKIEMIYWYADYPTEPVLFPYNDTQHTREWDALTSLITEIGNHRHFPLTEDEKKCAYCPYRSYCNRGEKAGRMDGLTETDPISTDLNYEQIAEIEF